MQLPAPGGTSLTFPNPLGVAHLPPLLRAVPVGTLNGLFVAFAAFLAAAFVSLVVRYRAGGRLLRQQVKWLALVDVAFARLPAHRLAAHPARPALAVRNRATPW